MKKLLLLPLLLINSYFLQAQNELSFSAGSGLIYYLGELNESIVFTNPTFLRPSANISLSYKALPHLNLNLQFMAGSLYADDSYADGLVNYSRNLHFKTSIQEFTLTAVIKPLNTKKAIPYVFFGAGMFWFNPKALYGTEWIELQPLGTEGQTILNGDYPKPYALLQPVIPIGVGIEIKASENIGFKFEAAFHKTFTDYIDDVSMAYPDSANLAGTANGPVATTMSYRGFGFFPENGTLRGDAKNKDSYVNITFSLLIYLRGSKNSGKSTFRFQPN
jgi:hypothetical protein